MLKHVAFWAFVFLPFSTGDLNLNPVSNIKSLTIVKSGLYFHIGETERKCFIEEIPDETMVTGNYKVLLSVKATNNIIFDGLCHRFSFMTQGPMDLHHQGEKS